MTESQPAPAGAPAAVAWPRFSAWLMAGLFGALMLLVYLPAMRGGYIWDDSSYISDNPTLRSPGGLAQIWGDLTATPQYYPLVFTSFWLEYHLWELNPLGYHVVNVLLHMLAAFLLWRLLVRLQLPGAWLAAGIFALHPVAVESVVWVTERKNVLAAAFYFAAAIAYLRYAGNWGAESGGLGGAGKIPQPATLKFPGYWLALALFLCAMLSKTVACSFPAALLLVCWWKKGRLPARDVWPTMPFFAIGAGLGLVTAWVEKHHVGAEGADWSLTFLQRCLIAGRALWFYAGKLVWPSNLTFIYPRWDVSVAVWWQWIFPVTMLGTVVALWSLRNRIGRGPLVAVLFFAGTLFPALGFFDVYPMRYSFVADHFQYLAGVGLIALGTAVLSRLPKQFQMSLMVVPLILGMLTWQQTRIYRNQETLWRDTLAKNPACWMARGNLANILLNQGQINEAISQFQETIRQRPDDAEAHNNLGAALAMKGQIAGAMRYYQEAIRLKPDYAEARNNLGDALLKKGQIEEAIRQFQEAIRLKLNYAEAYSNLGNALLGKGQIEEAMQCYQKAVRLKPDYAMAQYNLGVALAMKGQIEAAMRYYQKAIRLKPDYAEACNNLGDALLKNGRIGEAIRQFQEALRLKPDYAEARNNLGNALLEKGQIDEAIRQFQEALRLNTEYAQAYNNLGVALGRKGRIEEAIRQFQEAVRLKPDGAEARNNLARALEIEKFPVAP